MIAEKKNCRDLTTGVEVIQLTDDKGHSHHFYLTTPGWYDESSQYTDPRGLCRHDSSMRIQQTHSHPGITPDGDYVVFTSDRSGNGNVYTAPLVELESLPLAEHK